jgi:hypothetical protein
VVESILKAGDEMDILARLNAEPVGLLRELAAVEPAVFALGVRRYALLLILRTLADAQAQLRESVYELSPPELAKLVLKLIDGIPPLATREEDLESNEPDDPLRDPRLDAILQKLADASPTLGAPPPA